MIPLGFKSGYKVCSSLIGVLAIIGVIIRAVLFLAVPLEGDDVFVPLSIPIDLGACQCEAVRVLSDELACHVDALSP